MRATIVAIALLAAVAVVWCGQAVRKAERSTGNDLIGYLAASQALYAQEDPYHLPDRFPYIYPLFLATVVRPLASLSARSATIAWFALQWLCLLYVAWPARVRIGTREIAGATAIALLVAVFGDVLQVEFLNGQVNLIVVALVVASVRLADRRESLGAFMLGAAVAIKLTPALMLVYWLVRRRVGLVAQAGLWALVLILLPWLVVGQRLWPLYGDYVHGFILARTQSADPHGAEIFFSAYGFIGWLTSSAPGRAIVLGSAVALLAALVAWQAGVRARFSTSRRGQSSSGLLQHFGDPSSPPTTGGGASGVRARFSRFARTRKSSSDPGGAAGGLEGTAGWEQGVAWVYLAATPLFSPMSEVHHLTALLPLSAVAGPALFPFAGLLWVGRFDRRGPWYFLAVVWLVVAGCVMIRRRLREAV